MSKNKKHIEKLANIEIFSWENWDEVDTDWLQFYDCEFLLPELEKYNDSKPIVVMNRNGDMQIYVEDENSIDINAGSLKSFRDKLLKMEVVEDV